MNTDRAAASSSPPGFSPGPGTHRDASPLRILLAIGPGTALASLRAIAADAGPTTLAAFDAARARLASEAIAVLGSAPKAVSQANAEDLLARRVYTDPGYFLIELLQNAEDAAARTWRVVFDRTRIVVWHDGHPFDARDFVGVLPILASQALIEWGRARPSDAIRCEVAAVDPASAPTDDDPFRADPALDSVAPENPRKPHDMNDVIHELVDDPHRVRAIFPAPPQPAPTGCRTGPRIPDPARPASGP